MDSLEKELFNKEKIKLNQWHSDYSIRYIIYYSKRNTTSLSNKKFEEEIEDYVEKKNSACFSQVIPTCLSLYNKYKSIPNRIRYFCDTTANKVKALHLSKTEIQKWVKLCKLNGLMPKNINTFFIKTGIFDIKIDDISKEKLYVYLITARYIQEEPFFVRAVISLMEDSGLGFFTAFSVATTFTISNQGHHLLPFSRVYGLRNSKNALNSFSGTFKFYDIASLARYVRFKDRNKPLLEMDWELPSVPSFRLYQHLSLIRHESNNKNNLSFKKEELYEGKVENKILDFYTAQ